MLLTVSLRRVAKLLVIVLAVLVLAGICAEYARYIGNADSKLVNYFSLTEEKNFPTWWSSFLLFACSMVLFAIAAMKTRAAGDMKTYWIVLGTIFCYLSVDEMVEIHEWLALVPGLGSLSGFLYYGWVIPAFVIVIAFALNYLKFLFHLPMTTRVKVALAGVLYVGGAAGIEMFLGFWTDTHGELNFTWAMIGLVEEVLEILGASLFLYALLEYLGRASPDFRIAILLDRDPRGTIPMPEAPSEIPAWTRWPWVKWSWLLVVGLIIVQSLDFHWRFLPTTASGYFARGKADYQNAEYERSVENFTKAIERDPSEPDMYIWRGEAYAYQDDFAKAKPDLDKALQLKPDYPKAYAAVGDVATAAWDWQAGIKAYSRALALDPEYTRVYLRRGRLYYDAQDWDSAASDLRESARMLVGDDQVDAYLFLWLARARSGRARTATEELAAVMKAGRVRGDRFWAGAQFLCGAITESAYLDAIPKFKPSDLASWMAEAEFLAAGRRRAFGDDAGALPLFRKVLEQDSESYALARAREEIEAMLLGFHVIQTEDPDGLKIDSVSAGGPAEAAGIRPDSTLKAIDGDGVDRDAFIEFLLNAEPGSTVELQLVSSEGSPEKVSLTLTPVASAPTK